MEVALFYLLLIGEWFFHISMDHMISVVDFAQILVLNLLLHKIILFAR